MSGRAGTSTAIACQRRQRQHALDVEELFVQRLRRQPQRAAAARPRHARRAGRARQLEPERLVLLRDRRPQSVSFSYNGYHESDRQGTTRHNIGPYRQLAAVRSASSITTGFRYNINNDDAQWVTNEEVGRQPTRYVFGRLKQRTVGVHLPRQLHADAEPVDPDLRRAVRLGRRLHELPGAGERPRRPSTPIATRPYAYTDNADFNIRSFRTTNVLRWEYKPGLVAVRRVAAEPRRRWRVPATSVRPRLRRRLLRPRRTTCFW